MTTPSNAPSKGTSARWSPGQVLLASALGGPLAGCMLLAADARARGSSIAAPSPQAWLATGGAFQALLVGLGAFAPEGFPLTGLAAAGVVVPWTMTRQIRTRLGEEDAPPRGWGKAVALGVACLVASLVTGLTIDVAGNVLLR